VEVRDGRPVQVDAFGVRGDVVLAAGPWHTSGDWWTPEAWNRDEWDVALESGGVYRMFQETGSGRWFVEGAYD